MSRLTLDMTETRGRKRRGYTAMNASTLLGATGNRKDMKLRLLVVISTAASLTSFAQQMPQQLADKEVPSLLIIYKDLHSHPELSTQE